MIVFGGGLGNTSPCENDVWSLENANDSGGNPNWAQLNASGSPPAPRVFHTAVYDQNTDTMIVFGGEDCFATDFGDVWVLTNASGAGGTPTWAQLQPSGASPAPRHFHVATYDPSTNSMTVFGGSQEGGAAFLNDVWVLSHANGTGGTPAWVQLTPSGTAPAPRDAVTGVYNSAANRLTIFGGESNTSGNSYNDVWVLSHANGSGGVAAWKQLGPFSTPPDSTARHTAVYNSTTNVMTIFGGVIVDAANSNEVQVLTRADGL